MRVTVFDSPYAKSYLPLGQVLDFKDACETDWSTDAHFAPYVSNKCRVKKDVGNVPINLLVWDFDGPDHQWSDSWWGNQTKALNRLTWIEQAAWYCTRGGYRLVLAPPRPLSLMEWRAFRKMRESELQGVGLEPDPACKDWNRLYRLPRVYREGDSLKERDGDFSLEPNFVEHGERNGFLASLAGFFVHAKLSPDVWFPSLVRTNQELLRDPLPESEVHTIGQSIASYSEGEVLNGGDVELADLLIANYGQTLTDRDKVWVYDPNEGVWDGLAESTLFGEAVSRYEGSAGGGGKPIRMTKKRCTAILDMLKIRTHKEAYFDNAPLGLVALGKGKVWDAGEIRAATPDDRLTWNLGLDMTRNPAPPVRFLDFLEEVVPDAPSRLILQEFMGAVLAGTATKYERYPILLGSGANGKSVFCKVLTGLVPTDRITSISPHDMDHEYSKAALSASSLNLVEELPEEELQRSETLKIVTTGGLLQARRAFGQPFNFRNRAACAFAANMLPSVRDFSHGFWRRVMVIPFPVQIPVERQIRNLGSTLLNCEREGILHWALEGARRLEEQNGYSQSQVSEVTTQEWRHAVDNVSDYLTQRGIDRFKESLVGLVELLGDYRNWTMVQGMKPLGLRNFKARLERLGIKEDHSHRVFVPRELLS